MGDLQSLLSNGFRDQKVQPKDNEAEKASDIWMLKYSLDLIRNDQWISFTRFHRDPELESKLRKAAVQHRASLRKERNRTNRLWSEYKLKSTLLKEREKLQKDRENKLKEEESEMMKFIDKKYSSL